MAADYPLIIENLCDFYDFTGKTVISVGMGGGQLSEYARRTGRVIAVDRDKAALDVLKDKLEAAGLAGKVELVQADFLEFERTAGVVLFEFCLHEIPDPAAAIEHARALAPDVVVMDHWPTSEWIFYGAEDGKVAASWKAVGRAGAERTQSIGTRQHFRDFGELEAKVRGQGPLALERIESFRGRTDIEIPMSYGLALLRGKKD